MNAAVLTGLREPLAVKEVELDQPWPQEVVIRTVAAGVCHSDLIVVDGAVPQELFPALPMVLGHESAGIVEAVGELVSYVQPGDHVVTCSAMFCGRCEYCLTGRPALCTDGAVRRTPQAPSRITQSGRPLAQFAGIGSFAERLLVHENAVVKVRDEMPLNQAALLGCGVTTGLGAVFNAAQVAPGTQVAVVGCGGVGLSAIQGARIAGALRIVAVDPLESRRELARELGATELVDARVGDAVEQVLDLTGGGVDHAFEAVGREETVSQAFRMLRPGGTATVVGSVVGQTLEVDGTRLQMGSRRIQGTLMGSTRFRIDIPRFVDFYLQGRLRLDEMTTSVYPLEKINEAMSTTARGEGARTVVVFE